MAVPSKGPVPVTVRPHFGRGGGVIAREGETAEAFAEVLPLEERYFELTGCRVELRTVLGDLLAEQPGTVEQERFLFCRFEGLDPGIYDAHFIPEGEGVLHAGGQPVRLMIAPAL